MGLIDRLRSRLRRGGSGTDFSSPERLMRATAVLEENGQLAEAAVLLSEGVRRFPQAAALRAQRDRIERRRVRERIADLIKTLESRPDPTLAVELIRIYRRTGDTVSARRVSAETLEKFPDHALLHQVTGELWLGIFEQTGSAQDGLVAMQNLEKCICLDGSNVPAREMLVLLYGKIGAWRKALHHAVRVLGFTRPGPVGQIALAALVRQGGEEEDAAALMRRYVRTSEKEARTRVTTPTSENVSKALGLLQDLKGRRAAVVVAGDGLFLDGLLGADLDKDLLARAVHNLASAAAECCSQMSIGSLVMAQLEAPDATAYLRAVPEVKPEAGEAADPLARAPARPAAVFLLADSSAQKREVLARLARI